MDLVRVNAAPSVDEPQNIIYSFEKVEDGKGTGVFYLITAPPGTFPLFSKLNVKGPVVEMSEYEPKYFVMNPETDDLLPSGFSLELGMRVLIEENGYRQDLEYDLTPKYEELRDRYNRWCTVFTDPEFFLEHTTFIARYDDGTKKQLRVPTRHAWYVKK